VTVAEIRQQVYDRQGGRCRSCDKFVTSEQAHMHEKVHRGQGGEISLDNSEILCYDCHLNREEFGHGKRKPQFRRKGEISP
jgi:5-methylcytosine-specific restriction endonuclease McrA